MKSSSTNKKLKIVFKVAAVLFWIGVWQLFSVFVKIKHPMGANILIATPLETFKTLLELIKQKLFWKTISFSASKIALGFLYGLIGGLVLAVLAYICEYIKLLLSAPLKLIKSVPVVCFILLALFYVNKKELATLISCIMVLPIMYTNILQGLESTDKELQEMAKVFRISPLKRLRYIYIPAFMPSLISACSVGLGFCWKSGVAAEVIGITNGSIGYRLYEAKLDMTTADIFAWTAVIVLLSLLFEKLAILLLKLLSKALQ